MALIGLTAAKPDVCFFPLEFEVLDDAFGFPVLSSGSGFDEVSVNASPGCERTYVWRRTGSLAYTNLRTGETIEGSFRRKISGALDPLGTLNADGSTTFTQSDHGSAHTEVLPRVGPIFRRVGVTELEFTFDGDGSLIAATSEFHRVIGEPSLPSRLCEALA